MKRLLGLSLLLVLAACSGASSNVHAQVASNQAGIGVGEQRVLIGIVDIQTGRLVASSDLEVSGTLRDRNGSPLDESPGELVWIIPDIRGVYSFTFDIPEAGSYQVTLQTSEHGQLAPAGLAAAANPPVVGVGDNAPLSITRTIPEYEIRDITSDPNPEPSFYEMTVAEAVQSGPSVLVFGTPAWCASQACGPMLDQVKGLSAEFPNLNFVHIEVYENIHVSSATDLVFVPSVREWGLVAEPIIFVTDANGVVTAALEGAASDNELRRAFTAVSN